MLYLITKEHSPETYKELKQVYKKEGISKEIENEEIKELKKAVKKSPEIQRMLSHYEQLRPYLDSKQEESARRAIASKLYALLKGDIKIYFDVEDISIYMPKISLGLVKLINKNSDEEKGFEEGGVEKWLYLIEDENEAAKILTRIYSRELEKKKNPSEARIFLKKLKNGKQN